MKGIWSSPFQSPQWGSNSKGNGIGCILLDKCFSPRNGEVILKMDEGKKVANYLSFSPRNGEVILKLLGEYVIK